VSDGGQASGGSGFDWGLRPSSGGNEPEELEAEAPDSPAPDPFSFAPPAPEPVAPNPVAPDPFSFGAPAAEPPAPGPVPPEPFAPWESGATQLMPQTEPSPFEAQLFATEASPPPTELLGSDPIASGEPDSALDALFGETQFREYETGVLDPSESPFAVRSARVEADAVGEVPERAEISRTQKILMSVAGGLVAVLALVALFFVGTRLPAVFATQAPVASSSPSPKPTPTSTTAAVGPVANGVHPWTDLLGGECLDPYTGPWAEKFTVVDCAKPHPAQMVFRGTFDTSVDPSFPGVDKLQSQISLLCAAPGVINLAAAGAYNDAQIQGSYPVNDDEWTNGEHDYFCFVSRSSGQPLTGSVAVPRAAPPAATPTP